MKKEKLKAVLPIAVIALILAVSTLAMAQDDDNESATYALRSPLEASEVLSQWEASEVELKAFDGSVLPMAFSTIISDPNEGKTVDIKQLDADCVRSGSTLTDVTISVVYYTSINTSNQLTYIWLDTDQNPSTGIKESDAPGLGLNDIGADRIILVYQGLAGILDINGNLISPVFSVSPTSNSETVTIPIDYFADDGCMDVSLISGIDVDPVTAADVAPNTGHGTIKCCDDGNDGCLLTISQPDATNFPTIKAIATITDTQGNPIPGLMKSDFTVTENGQNAEIGSVNCGGNQCEITWTTPFTDSAAVPSRTVVISMSHGGMTCSGTAAYTPPDVDSGNCTFIHLDGKNCVNQPFVARLTEENENPIQGTITFSIGGSQYPMTTDAQGYTTFTPQTTGTLTATYFDSSAKRWEVTCEIIDDKTLCPDGGGTCNFCQDPTQGTVSITSFTTDKSSYSRGQTIKVTMVANNAETCIYKKLLTAVSATESSTGTPLGFSGSWSMFDIGTNTYEMRMYIPTAIAPGSYTVTGSINTDYIAQGGTPKAIASPVTVTIS